jgi:apolipoprotein N-acyltransferase
VAPEGTPLSEGAPARLRGLVVGLGLTAASAVLFGLAFPPVSARFLGWIALAPLLAAVRLGSAARAVGLAACWSVLAAYAVGDWMPRAIVTYYEQSVWVGWAFFVGCALLMAAPYYAAAAWGIQRLGRAADRGGRVFGAVLPWLVAAVWTAAEWGRGRLFTGTPFFIGNPWALLGYSQVGWDAVVQVASVTGVYGISFAMAAANAGLAEAIVFGIRRGGAFPWTTFGLSWVPAAGLLVFGMLALREVGPAVVPAGGTPIAVIQGNLDAGARWRSDLYGENLGQYLRLTRAALERAPETRLVLWPEAAMTFFLEDEPIYRRSIAGVVARAGAELAVGGTRRDGPDRDPRYYNTVFWLDSRGEIGARTDKALLMPFAEHFPLGGIEWLRRRFERVRTFTPASETRLLPTAAGPAAVAICNEAMLPEVISERVGQGAAWILNPSNDTWIPEPRFAEQQLDIVALRAVEQRRWLVRSSTAGPSAVIDPWGRVVGRTDLGERKVLIGAVHARDGRSVYARVGDAFAGVCATAAVVALLAARRRSGASSDA